MGAPPGLHPEAAEDLSFSNTFFLFCNFVSLSFLIFAFLVLIVGSAPVDPVLGRGGRKINPPPIFVKLAWWICCKPIYSTIKPERWRTCMKYVRKHQSSAFVTCEDIALQAWNAEERERTIRSISQKILTDDGWFLLCLCPSFCKIASFLRRALPQWRWLIAYSTPTSDQVCLDQIQQRTSGLHCIKVW